MATSNASTEKSQTDPYAEKIDVPPAASTWTGACPTELDQQVAFFTEKGFLILRGVLTKQEIEELDRETDHLVRDHQSLGSIREGFSPEPGQDPNADRPVFRKIGGMSDLSEAFARLMRHPRILDVVHAIAGPQIHLFRDVLMMKAPRIGREKPWHQDSVYWPWRPMRLVSAMTALDDATPENGCLQVIPGSHRQEVQHYGGELQIDLDQDLRQRTVFVPLKAGDTLVFHSLLLHASQPNHSDKPRRVAILSYRPGDLHYIGKGDPPEAVLVSQRPPA